MMPAGATDPYPGTDTETAKPNPRRAVEAATLVIIAATVIAVVASSWPIVVAWIDAARPDVARQGIARALQGRGWAVGTPRSQPPPDVDRTPHRPTFPFGDHGVPGLETHPVPPGTPTESLIGAVAKPLTIVQLLDRADPDGLPVMSVNPNETLLVVKELTPWVLLAAKREGKVEFGWTTRNQVAISRLP